MVTADWRDDVHAENENLIGVALSRRLVAADTLASMVQLRRPEFIVLDKKRPDDPDEDDQVEERHPAATMAYAGAAILVLIALLALASIIRRLVG